MKDGQRIIDFHLHFFPDKIAEKAMSVLAHKADLSPFSNGTFENTIEKMNMWGIDRAVALSIATNERQTESVNNFAASFLGSERIVPFASVYPGAKNAISELNRIKDLGFKGVKLHPEYQDFEVADEKAFPVYEFLEKAGLILMLHAGRDKGYPDSFLAPPKSIKAVADTFPKLKIIAAHLGGWCAWDEVYACLAGSDVYFDTSMTPGYLDVDSMRKIIFKHGPEKILFGTDCPWSSAPDTIKLLEKVGLSNSDLELVYCINAENLLKL